MTDLAQFLAGGAATRPDSLSGLNADFSSALAQMFAAAPQGLTINSAYRSPELQAQLWDEALAKYGDPEIADNWVAPPGRSQHGHGNAVDLGFAGDEARAWAHANAGNFGLAFPMAHEPWHVELAGARGGGGGATQSVSPMPSGAPPDMTAAMGLMPGGAGQPGGGMLLGDIAAQFLAGQQQRQQAQREEQEAEEVRRAALLGGGIAGLYG